MKGIGIVAAMLMFSSLVACMPTTTAGADAPLTDIVWEGTVYVNESIIIQPNETLIIRPGTTVRIRDVAASCTEGNLPMISVTGRMLADGTSEQPIKFISISCEETGCTLGREAMMILGIDANLTSDISHADFLGGAIILDTARVNISRCDFDRTYLGFRNDLSILENSTLLNSPFYIYGTSQTLVRNNDIRRTSPDDVGVHVTDGVKVINNTIADCMYGIEGANFALADILNNTITGCTEGIHSGAALNITGNLLFDNEIGLNTTLGIDYAVGNTIYGGDVGIVTFGDPGRFLNNSFAGLGFNSNKVADIQQKLIVLLELVDANGQTLVSLMKLVNAQGATLYDGVPTTLFLVAYERTTGGVEKRFLPYTASATLNGTSNSTTFTGMTSVRATLRLELLPDLCVVSFRGPPADIRINDPNRSDMYTFVVKVRNNGVVTARNAALEVFIDGQSEYLRYVPSLEPGEERTYAFDWTMTDGTHSFKASIDYYQRVRETNEKNNINEFSSSAKPVSEPPAYSASIQVVLLMVVIGIVTVGLAKK
jgi:archaellum component FlaG (FlaF/FlaG flagellin family)